MTFAGSSVITIPTDLVLLCSEATRVCGTCPFPWLLHPSLLILISLNWLEKSKCCWVRFSRGFSVIFLWFFPLSIWVCCCHSRMTSRWSRVGQESALHPEPESPGRRCWHLSLLGLCGPSTVTLGGNRTKRKWVGVAGHWDDCGTLESAGPPVLFQLFH